jgi:2-amino-4-hydroxy-6-hydroxymethyldihydropteridine diphosphokinase
MAEVYLLLGSNLGNKTDTLRRAVGEINKSIGATVKISSLYKSPPWGFEHREYFVNQVVLVKTALLPEEILEQILAIENTLGRNRKPTSGTYQARTIDIDLLYYNHRIISKPDLIVPHPKIQFRKFTLVPLCEIDPEYMHPVLKKTQQELYELCDDCNEVTRL